MDGYEAPLVDSLWKRLWNKWKLRSFRKIRKRCGSEDYGFIHSSAVVIAIRQSRMAHYYFCTKCGSKMCVNAKSRYTS